MHPGNFRSLALVAMGSLGALFLVAGGLTALFFRRKPLGDLTALTLLVGGAISIALGFWFYLINYGGSMSG